MTDENPSLISHVSIGTNDFCLVDSKSEGDPDRHKIEAAFWDLELMAKLQAGN